MKQKLIAQIATALKSRVEIGLPDLIEIYPINCGMEEVVEYLKIAHQPPHLIDDDLKDWIEVSNISQDSQMMTTMPRIVFRREA
jgi:Protein of unknown function (DUF3375)